MNEECYISVDIESAGPIPGKYSMLSLGACVVGNVEKNFYVELQPITNNFVPEALAVTDLDMPVLEVEGIPAAAAMKWFREWVEREAVGKRPVFVGFNACFDWQFVNWYFVTYDVKNPFGFSGIDIKSYYMGKTGVPWSKTTSSQLPAEFQPDSSQTHNALDDAKAQASIFAKLIASHSE